MSTKPYDVTVKDLLEEFMPAWPAILGNWHIRSVRVIDADLSTVSAAADKVMYIEGDDFDWLLHIDPQSSHEIDLPKRLHMYNAILSYKHGLPVRTIVLLLRREASASTLTGNLELGFPDDDPYDVFHYKVVPLWEMSAQQLLTGSIGLLPFAPLTDEAAQDLPATLEAIDNRLRAEADVATANKLRTATYVLLGLNYSAEQIDVLFRGITEMQESSTYQAIIAKGMEKGMEAGAVTEARKFLILMGAIRFGEPDDATSAILDAESSVERLEELGRRLFSSSSWQELLASE